MKLFNIIDKLKMLVQDEYELTLFKLYCRFIFVAGYVKLRGDRYLYNGKPVVRLNQAAGYMLIELHQPDFPEALLLPGEEKEDQNIPGEQPLIQSFHFRIGGECQEEFRRILDHIRSVNELHIHRKLAAEISNKSPLVEINC